MTENMKKFLKLLSQKEELAEKINKTDKEEIVAIAKDLGVELTEADFVQNNELDDNELDAVSGGVAVCFINGIGTSRDEKHICKVIGVGFNSFYFLD